MTSLAALLLSAALLVVSPSGPYRTIDAALADARPGDTIEVRGGVYGPVAITKSVTLRGSEGAVLDGGGEGDVVHVDAPNVTLEGFEIRNSGRTLDREHAGVTVLQAGAVIRDNHLHDVLFGIFLKGAPDSIVERNTVEGYPFDSARRGDGIRSWYSPRILVRDNHVQGARDVIFWFSNDARIEGNVVTGGRYGLHFMYDDGLEVRDNIVSDNSVGMFVMYSSNVLIERNLIRDSGGPSGYGIGLKELANIEVRNNVLLHNRVGVSFDSTPHGEAAFARFSANLLAFNQVGMSFQPDTQRVELTENSFDRNVAQLEVRGSGDLLGNTWTGERGNYWSDYAGYDADRDGLGDLAYEPRSLFASLRDEHPVLALFNQSPAAMAVDFAARAVPDLQPSARVVDTAPLMKAESPAWFTPPRAARAPWFSLAAGTAVLAAIVAGGVGHPFVRRRALTGVREEAAPAIATRGLTKRYGEFVVLDGLNLTVAPGESVALWGSNGAGKTTALRCILGLLRADGDVAVHGVDVRRDPRRLRSLVGYVPQDQQMPDMPVSELFRFIARLHRVELLRADATLDLVALRGHAAKRPSELSGGLRQRLALGLALVGAPRVLLLDEPTANLDEESRGVMFGVLGDQRRAGTTVLFTTHRVDEVVQLADRVVTIEQGRVESTETMADFTARHALAVGLLVRVAPGDRERARAVLAARGATVEARADWLALSDCPIHEALGALQGAGIAVQESLPGTGV